MDGKKLLWSDGHLVNNSALSEKLTKNPETSVLQITMSFIFGVIKILFLSELVCTLNELQVVFPE